jgi:outer membrane lipoprotein-sorting protein
VIVHYQKKTGEKLIFMQRVFVALIAVLGPGVQSAAAAPPNADTVVRKMKEVFEPERPSVRRIVIAVKGVNGVETAWVAVKAQKTLADGKRSLLVMLEPESAKGKALLVGESANQSDIMWAYLPGVRRVRQIGPLESHSSFFDTDFTYADLGFIDRQGSYVFRGEEDLNGVKTYKVSKVSKEREYYSRIFTWVAADSMLPLKREYYDPAGNLWKIETFEKITTIEGVPTPLLVRMEDVRADSSSEFRVSEVRFNIDIPDTLFDPANLSRAADSDVWRNLGVLTATSAQSPETK